MEELPVDLVLEVVARSDAAATVVRCAAVSKPPRRTGGFDPARLVAASFRYRLGKHGGGDAAVIARTSRRLLHDLDGDLLRSSSFAPACSRDGFLVLWRREDEADVEIRACDAFTGHVASLPRSGLGLGRGTHGIYRSALLAVGDGVAGAGRRPFELLAMDDHFRVQTFSSQDGEWGAARRLSLSTLAPLYRNLRIRTAAPYYSAPPAAVIGRTVYWLLMSSPPDGVIIVAVHTDTAQATVIELPEGSLLQKRFLEAGGDPL
ncbi:hypothetical protein ACP4OV_008285 [Aristida adscensionis]